MGTPQQQVVLTYPAAPPALDVTKASGAATLVTGGWNQAQAYASNAVTSANAALDKMNTTAQQLGTLPNITGTLAAISKTIGAFVAPAAPTAPANLAFAAPVAPVEPGMTAIAALDTGTAPTFTATAPSLDLSFAAPTPLTTAVPSAPVLGSVAIPVAPAVPLPSVPTLLSVTVPTQPLLSLPVFSGVPANSPQAAAYTFSFAETQYTSSLLDDLRARLQEWVNGAATGLSPTVEAALWERGRAREIVNAGRKAKEVMRNFARRGFAKPSGALATELADAAQEAQDASSTINRDISIEQAKLEQENRRFAFDEAFKVEAMLVTYSNQIAQRAFDAARFTQEAGIQIYQANVSRYSADIQAYAARVDQWKGAIQAELTKLETFRSAVESQKLTSEINTQTVETYRARVEAAKTVIDIFRAQVDAANTQAMINKTQIEAFGAQVNAYGESVRAKASEYDGYATRIRAEVSKADVFKAQAEAYSAQVDGFKALVSARVEAKNMEIKINREVPLDLFRLRTDVFRTLTDAERTRVETVADVFGKNVGLYSAQVQGQVGRMEAETGAYNAEVVYRRAQADNTIALTRGNVEVLTQRMLALIDATKSGATVQAQMAASALSSVNLSGSISAGTSSTQSNSYGQNVGFAYSNANSVSNSYTASDQSSVSNSTTTSTGTNNNTNHNLTT